MKKTTLLGICGIVGSILTIVIVATDIKARREVKEAEQAVNEMHKLADPFIKGYENSLKYSEDLDRLLATYPSNEEKLEVLLGLIKERQKHKNLR